MGSPFEIQTRPQQVSYAVEGVQPPTGLAVSTNDQLVIKVHNSNAAPGLRVFVRLLLPDGTISPGDFPITPDATRAVNTFAFPLDEGFILSAVVFSTATGLFRGQCYVRLLIFRGSLTQQFVGYMLAEGYVTTATSLGFPTGPQEYARSGRGVMRSITGTTPAVGVEVLETVPTGAVWRVASFVAVLRTSNTVAVRTPCLQFMDASTALAVAGPGNTISQGNTLNFQWAEGMYQVRSSLFFVQAPLPFMRFLPAGFRIATLTGNLQVDDQYTSVNYLVEEWLQL